MFFILYPFIHSIFQFQFRDFPKKPDSVYNIFYRSFGKKLRDDGMKTTDVMKACAVKWNSLNDEEKVGLFKFLIDAFILSM